MHEEYNAFNARFKYETDGHSPEQEVFIIGDWEIQPSLSLNSVITDFGWQLEDNVVAVCLLAVSVAILVLSGIFVSISTGSIVLCFIVGSCVAGAGG